MTSLYAAGESNSSDWRHYDNRRHITIRLKNGNISAKDSNPLEKEIGALLQGEEWSMNFGTGKSLVLIESSAMTDVIGPETVRVVPPRVEMYS